MIASYFFPFDKVQASLLSWINVWHKEYNLYTERTLSEGQQIWDIKGEDILNESRFIQQAL